MSDFPTDADTRRAPGFLSVFWLFCAISAVTIGGGYVMVPVIQRAVERKRWLKEADFYDLFAMAQSIPGPLALNSATLTGWKIAGLPGFIAATLGILLPPFAAIILLASIISAAGDHPALRGFLDGAFAVVPGLVAALAFNVIRKRQWTVTRAVMTLAGAAALILAGTWAVPVFFGVVVVARLFEGVGR
ncbi:MAG: chromate transporter [Spirochaetales bacterium]|nr:chromate transporter [Spirochaetales bacterium]MBP7264421.1 chromate transporter [Spirochaetia bacterium]